ncbi:histidinol dehydrogenase [Shouchella clausii]|uniref:histidinol dehydrogenase n=1 Tax=Shouchella clausii TaxID=79880 RepID=UPI00289FAD43|nr:histidinol dehydrogenase [Shouchella clausii]
MPKFIKEGKNQEEINIDDSKVRGSVESIIKRVQIEGDEAVKSLSLEFDNWAPNSFKLSSEEIQSIINEMPAQTIEDIQFAQANVRRFAEAQKLSLQEIEVENLPGVVLGHKNIPVKSAGCYIPGGRYPMLASAHMSVLTAKVAGVERVVACTPPINGEIPKTTVASIALAGADEIYILGGVQAMAFMSLGTESFEPVDMIVGPGNAFVAEAKRQLFGKVGIDLLAGPSEVLIIADETADAEMVATDILGQAEHGPTSPCALITTSEKLAVETIGEIERQLEVLPTREVAQAAWEDYGVIIKVNTFEEAVIESEKLGYEHIQVLTKDNDYFLERLRNYGALFLGPETNVAYGDKVIGTNHTLPTKGASRYTGGLWVGKFIKTVTYQKVKPEASALIGEYCDRLSKLENFPGHAKQGSLRVERYKHVGKVGL